LLLVTFVIAAAILAVPAFITKRVPVDIDVMVSQIEFDAEDANIAGLFGQTFSSAVTFSGFDHVSFSTGEARLAGKPPKKSSPVRVFESFGNDAQIEFKEITLDQVGSWGMNHVRIAATPGSPSRVSAIFESSVSSMTFAIGDYTPFSCRTCKSPSDGSLQSFSGEINAERPQLVQITSKQTPLSVAFNCDNGTSLLQGDIPVTGPVKFTRSSPANVRPISTVIAEGKIEVPGLTSKDRKIQAGDYIMLTAAPGFRISSLRVDYGLKVRLSGIPASIRIGKDSVHTESLEPSLLEWFHNHSPIVLFAQDVVLVSSAVLSIWKFLSENKS
jgi:hypothetical protein